jgi:ABC-type multidrug transport system fused ATPase/permease subunit
MGAKFNQIVDLLNLAGLRYKYQFCIVIVLTIASSFIDLVSLGLIFPLIFSFFDASVNISKLIPEFFIKLSLNEAIGLILISFLIKSILITAVNKYNLNYIFSLKRDLSSKIYKKYLYQDYINKKNTNSASFITAISSEINLFSNYIIEPIINGLNEIMIIIVGSILIIYFEPKVMYIILFFLIIYTFFYKFLIKNKIKKLSLRRQLLQEKILRHSQETAQLYKEIVIFSKSTDFVCQFNLMNSELAGSNMIFQFYQNIPRIWIEFFIILIISAITFSLTQLNFDKPSIFAILTIFSIFAFKLAPSFNRLINCWQSIRFGLPSIASLSNLTSIAETDQGKTHYSHQLHNSLICNQVCFQYPQSQTQIIQDLSVEIKRGSFTAIIGPSGSGKSTLIDLLLGLMKPTNGKIMVDCVDISHSLNDWREIIGYVPQDVNLLDASFSENIAMCFSRDEINSEKIFQSLQKAGLLEYVRSLPNGESTLIGEKGGLISGGQRQRLGIARALYRNAKFLILDEPTSSLDEKTSLALMQTLRELTPSTTILMVTHNTNLLHFCDQSYSLLNGTLQPLPLKK